MAMVFTRFTLLGLMTPLLIFGSALIYLLIHSHQTYEKLQSLSNDFTKIVTDIEELKTNEEILEKEVHSKHSFVDFLRVGEYGYFQKLEDKMSYKDGQAACHKIHGKIIESDERYGNATKKLYYVGSEFKWTKKNFGEGFNVPFYIGLINNNHEKNQWRWSSNGRIMSKDTLGTKGREEQLEHGPYDLSKHWKLISWAKGANGKKLRGNCVFVTYEGELKEIDCSTKFTIICEEIL